MFIFPLQSTVRVLGFTTLLLALGALQGCSMGNIALSGPEPVSSAAQIGGTVHGGQQPITGANIGLFAVGTGGYGSAATSILNAGVTVTSGAGGSFSVTGGYTCPTSTTLVYITATGGNPGLMPASTTNSAIELVALLGPCGALADATFVTINEVTTAAAAYALTQYFGAANADSFGSPNTTQALVGIANAFAVSNNLANVTTGTAIVTGTNAATLGSITYTPDVNKINTIADILAGCINTAGPGDSTGNCNTLLADTPPTGSTATDTLQAAVFLNLNPTSTNANTSASNMTALFGLVGATPPFPAVAGQPTDWTIGINYSAGVSAAQTLINAADDIAIDGGGNAWLINYNSNANTTEALTELSPVGVPLANTATGGTGAFSTTTPRNMAIDTNNNVYVTASGGDVYKYAPATAALTTYADTSQPYGIAIDGNNNVFVSHASGSTVGLDEFPGGVIASTNRIEYAFNNLAQYMTIDSSGNPYLSNYTTATQVVEVTNLNGVATCTTHPCTPANDTSLTSTYTSITGAFTTPFGLAAASSGGIWTTNSGANTVSYNSSPTASAVYGTTAATFFSAPRKVAVDGNNIAWILNRGTGTVSEITTAGAILSPVPTGSNTTPIGFVHAGLLTVSGLAIDPSGNVWVSNGTSSASATDQNSVFEIIGAAAPTTTPLAQAISAGKVGVKP